MAAEFIPEAQNELVAQIATVISDYRDNPEKFVKFELMCGMTLRVEPIAGRINVTPRAKNEQFRCKDEAQRAGFASDREAFFGAVEAFADKAGFLAWNGVTPEGKFELVQELSANFSHPTMSVELGYRRRGDSDEFRTSMVFIAFDDTASAQAYADKRPNLIK